jgi:uncharacterized protein with von Willebrand factor type A (vWA) domain
MLELSLTASAAVAVMVNIPVCTFCACTETTSNMATIITVFEKIHRSGMNVSVFEMSKYMLLQRFIANVGRASYYYKCGVLARSPQAPFYTVMDDHSETPA